MKLKIIAIALLAGFITQSCLEDCGECFTPPEPFVFEIVDKATGENLFTNGTYSSDQIEVIDDSDESNVGYTFLDENDLNLIRINSIGWNTEVVNYSFVIDEETIFTLHVDAERLTEDCCNFTRYNEITIDGSDHEEEQNTGVIKILVE